MCPQNQTTLKVGGIYKMTLTAKDGIKLKNGATSRDKYFAVLGFDGKHINAASLIINSDINPKMIMSIGPYQHRLSSMNYAFMTKKESYVDCSRIRTLPTDRIKNTAVHVGDMKADDLSEAMKLVKESRIIVRDRLLEFGLVTQEEYDARGW